jgi:hypothetical protein
MVKQEESMSTLPSQGRASQTDPGASPSVRKALVQLGVLLDDYHYSQHAKEQILAHVAREGTLAKCEYLDPDDEADCELVFVESLDSVPYSSPEWGPPDFDPDAGCEPIPDPLPESFKSPEDWA